MGVTEALGYARSKLGRPYVWGAAGPDSFDCSGLVLAAFTAGGVPITGRTTYDFVKEGQPVARADLQPGDLVFPDAGHVQIYEGAGRVIEAPHSGANVQEVPMWGFWQARRLDPRGAPGFAPSVADPAYPDGINATPGLHLPGIPGLSGPLFAGAGKLALELALGAGGLVLIVLGAKKVTGG